jgi:hypothetical protein
MKETKHTPGPWEFVDAALVGPKLDDKPVWLRPVILRSETGVKTNDARLIAAAPELLAACIGALAEIEAAGLAEGVIFGEDPAICEKLRAAIAKANGTA